MTFTESRQDVTKLEIVVGKQVLAGFSFFGGHYDELLIKNHIVNAFSVAGEVKVEFIDGNNPDTDHPKSDVDSRINIHKASIELVRLNPYIDPAVSERVEKAKESIPNHDRIQEMMQSLEALRENPDWVEYQDDACDSGPNGYSDDSVENYSNDSIGRFKVYILGCYRELGMIADDRKQEWANGLGSAITAVDIVVERLSGNIIS
ncbi:hypothetical protein COEREDRAFT_88070 [Coemansia reversa NRRL 1564]|uniref:Uncharacterized protein n=1 Tax=Coemansia reversa (strain ATCC 12441 / NRRL 1564) TaxID=763665 RepID=A0A2G5B8A2_COERN|nr:hypothetical protein COEREDRAFT_88070 [Coemansia reversa NRRL 1564]|eukprot:PIA15220.1 hypothetical protein COEREDRAFT_88070 [Coemansia reversa NRRL 1564]